MGDICIHSHKLGAAKALAEILLKRIAPHAVTDKMGLDGKPVSGAFNAFVCSTALEAELGGEQALLDLGRQLKATKILIIDESGKDLTLTSHLSGRLVRMGLKPEGADLPAHDFALQMAASLVTQPHHIAVGDAASLSLFTMAARVARTDVTVFINGPTGTGKEVLARFVHDHSPRRDKAFVAVNCAAIPENMLEAILFGHEKGAFTGASSANKGIFRAADGGTLLLDEISEMPLSLQAKLLRVLQEKSVTPIGAYQDIPVDVRVLATSNRNMPQEINEGRFREDLFYRLNVFPLNTLALGARRDDIIPISTVLLKRHGEQGETLPRLADCARDRLLDYGWPGNVRELENVLQRALVLCDKGVIKAENIITDMANGAVPLQAMRDDTPQRAGALAG